MTTNAPYNMTLDDIRQVKRFYDNFSVTMGIVIGIVLAIYFFTFSEIVDKAPPIVWKIQVITTALMVWALISLKRVSYFFTRVWLGKRTAFQPLFVSCNARDLEKSAEQLLAQVQH